MIRLATALVIRMALSVALCAGLLSGPIGVSVAHADGLLSSSLMAEGGDTVVAKNQKDAAQQDAFAEQSQPQQKQKSGKSNPHEAFDHVHDAPGLIPTLLVALPDFAPVAPPMREILYRSTTRLDHYRPPRT